MKILETNRLLLRPVTIDDLPFLKKIHSDPDVARYIGYGDPKTEEETIDWLNKTLHWYETENIGQLAVVLKSDNSMIGRCGISCFEIENKRNPNCYWGSGSAPEGIDVTPYKELGYTFAKETWGNGYATEAAKAMRDHIFSERKEPFIVSLIINENTASVKVAERLGLIPKDDVYIFEKKGTRYILTFEEWKNFKDKIF